MSHVDGQVGTHGPTGGFAQADYDLVGSKNLDECVQKIITAFANERTALWDAGDALNEAEGGLTPNADQEPLFRWLATQTGCTVNRLKQLSTVARTFEPGMRDLERAWSWHRAIYNAAKRNNAAPAEILALATGKNWTQRELDTYGSDREEISFRGVCGECDFTVSVRCRKPGILAMKGTPIVCPVCAAQLPGVRHIGVLVQV